MLGRNKRIKSNNQPHRTWPRTWSTILSKWKLAVLGLVFIPTAIISATNLTTPTAYAAVTIDECVALNDKGRDAGSITKETYENSGVCNIMKRYTNLDKEQVKADCGSKYGGKWVDRFGGWACNLIALTDGVNSRNGTRTIDPSIQTKDECDSVNGIWTADGNFEGPGEMGTCQVTVGASVDGSEEEGEELSCQIESIGWMVCPIFNAIGSLTDASYEVVERLLLTPTSMFNTGTDSNNALNTAWSIVRNVANVAFVIAFLLIIYSQLTGRGIGNYGIKKMLPRLIISAILVNASFIVSAIAVDISNIVGSSVSGLFSNLSSSIDASVGDLPWSSEGNIWGALVTLVISGGATALIVGGAAASGTIWLGIATLAPILVAAFFAILTVVIVLVLRQALIVLLIVVAPLAFVAFLLPNTEGLFRKWMKLFIVLLAMFPSIALIFSVSKLAGAIVMASSTDMLVQIAGAGMTIIPLFITPVVMKTAGGTLNRLTGTLNVGAGKGLTARAKKMRSNAFSRVSDQRMGNYQRRGLKGFLARAGSAPRTLSDRIEAGRERDKFRAGTVDSELKLASNEKYRQKMLELEADGKNPDTTSGRELTQAESRLMSQIRGQAQSDEQVEVKNAKAELQNQNPDELKQSLESAINTGDNIKVMASLELLTTKGDYGMKVIDQTLLANESAINQQFTAGNKGIRNDIAGTLQGTGAVSKSETLKAWAGSVRSDGTARQVEADKDGNIINDTEMSFERAQQTAMGKVGGLSAAKFANQSAHEQSKMIKSGNVSPELAANVLSSTRAGDLNGDVVKELTRIRGNSVVNPGGAATINPADKLTQTQPQPSQASSSKDGTLVINHDKPPVAATNQSVSAKQAAPAATQTPQPAFNPNQNQQPAGQPSGWTQTDSGLSIPRSAAPQAVQPASAPTPTATQAAPAQPVIVQQAAPAQPAQPAQPQKISVEVDTSGLKKDFKDAVSDLAYESRLKSSRVSDRAAALAEEKRRKRPGDDL